MLMLGIFNMPVHAIKFVFKGGASNQIDLAIFKGEKGFENFIDVVTGSKSAARQIEKFTQANNQMIGAAFGGVAGVALAATGVGAPVAIPATAAASTLGGFAAIGAGKLSILAAKAVRTVAEKYANHYFENMTPGGKNTACRGFTGRRLIRHKTLVGKDDLMDPNDKRDIFVAVFNKADVKDDAGKRIAKSYDIIYAGPVKAADLNGTFEITTRIIAPYENNPDGTPKKDTSGNNIGAVPPYLAAFVEKVSDTGGKDCPQ